MKKISYQIIFGVIIIIIGILLLLQTTGIYDTGQFLIYIPSLFILLGIYALWKSRFRNITGPLILIFVFGIIQLLNLNIISPSDISRWWPIILIIIGIGFLLNRIRGPARKDEYIDEIDLLAIFGGVDSLIKSKAFQGGGVTAIFGGVDLDLKDSKIKESPVYVNVIVLFGGVDIKVPDDWNVKIEAIPLLGGVDEERPRRKKTESEVPDLIVTGFAAFGGLSIKD